MHTCMICTHKTQNVCGYIIITHYDYCCSPSADDINAKNMPQASDENYCNSDSEDSEDDWYLEDNGGNTPLMLAIKGNHLQCSILLLSREAGIPQNY